MPEEFAADVEQLTVLGNALGEVAGACRDNKTGCPVAAVVMPEFASGWACLRLHDVLGQVDVELAERFQWNADLAHEHSKNYQDVENAIAQRIKQVQDRMDSGGK